MNQNNDHYDFKIKTEFDQPYFELQPEPPNHHLSLPYQQNKQTTNSPNPENQFEFHDYDNYINPRRHAHNWYIFRPQPKRDYRLLPQKSY